MVVIVVLCDVSVDVEQTVKKFQHCHDRIFLLINIVVAVVEQTLECNVQFVVVANYLIVLM